MLTPEYSVVLVDDVKGDPHVSDPRYLIFVLDYFL